jgi:hypothetical protein
LYFVSQSMFLHSTLLCILYRRIRSCIPPCFVFCTAEHVPAFHPALYFVPQSTFLHSTLLCICIAEHTQCVKRGCLTLTLHPALPLKTASHSVQVRICVPRYILHIPPFVSHAQSTLRVCWCQCPIAYPPKPTPSPTPTPTSTPTPPTTAPEAQTAAPALPP